VVTRRSGAPAGLVALLEFQQQACRAIGSVVYDRVLQRSIDRVGRAGPIRDLLAPHRDDPFGSALALRYLGSVHRLVLEGRAPELAGHYPSVGGTPGVDLEECFEAVVGAHLKDLRVLIEAGVQTNEVGRSATLLGGLLDAAGDGLPLRVLELGASAGLNLRWDHYRYEAGAATFGPPDSPVRFVGPWVDHVPPLDVTVEVVERRGCDPAPIDATTPAGRLTQRSFVWPDLVERLARLDAAIEVARTVPVAVDRADGVPWVAERLADPVEGAATVVVHSIVLQYMTADQRADLMRTMVAAGARATPTAPLVWLRLEPGREGAELRSTRWPGGAERLLAISAYHGPPVRWLR